MSREMKLAKAPKPLENDTDEILYRKPTTIAECMTALERGKLQMQRPHGDWVRVRARSKAQLDWAYRNKGTIVLFMEGQVEAEIPRSYEAIGFPGVRIVA